MLKLLPQEDVNGTEHVVPSVTMKGVFLLLGLYKKAGA